MRNVWRKVWSRVLIAAMAASLAAPALAAGGGSAGRDTADFPRLPLPVYAETAYVPGELLVGMEEGASAAALNAVPEARAVEPLGFGGVYRVGLREGVSVPRAILHLRSQRGVRYAEPNYIRRVSAVPNDPYYPLQVELSDGIGWGPLYDALAAARLRKPAKVAVVDTGVDSSHPDLRGRLLGGRSFVPGVSRPVDDNGHGTHVTGIIAAVTNNGVGMASVAGAARVQVLPVKVLDGAGSGADTWVAAGIRWAADQRADVINLSLGGGSYSETLAAAVRYAQAKGALVVAASGNEGGPVSYPAAYPGVLTVGATDFGDVPSAFSNFGPELDLAAPGEEIFSTYPVGSFAFESGTSMATPFVSGLAAALKSLNPNLTDYDLAARMFASAQDIAAAGFDEEAGRGRIDAGAAVSATAPPPAEFESPAADGLVTGETEVDVAVSYPELVKSVSVYLNTTKGAPLTVLGINDPEGRDERVLSFSWVPAAGLRDGVYNLLAVGKTWGDRSVSGGTVRFYLDRLPAATPTGLKASRVTSSSVTLTWKSNTDDTRGYRIYRDGIQVAEVLVPTKRKKSMQHTVSGLTPATTYQFTVTAYDPSDESPASNTVNATTRN